MPIPRFRLLYLPLAALLPSLPQAAFADVPPSTAFGAPSEPAGDTRFSTLTPAATGLVVDNRYDDPQMWAQRYREFMGGGMGSGLAAGDFDNDGLVDLYVSTKTKPGRLFRNLGNWRFEDVTDDANASESASLMGWFKGAIGSDDEVIWRQGAVFADINNDGWLDLHVSRNDAPNLMFVNQGDGTFEEEAADRGLDLADGSVVGAFADYDRDGWLDVFILTNQVEGTEPSGRSDRLFRNTGKGHFVEVTQRAGIAGATFGHSATWLDFNGDRWPDLYVANDFAGPDHLYRNNGDGTFTNVIDAVTPHTPYSSMGADSGDINNDGFEDLLVADMATTTREQDKRGLAASRADVLVMGTRHGTAPQYMRNVLLLNTGTGVFGEAACWAGLEATDWTWSLRFEDYDNDGWTDLHVTNGMVREANNSDLLARMMRSLSDMERIRVMKNAPPLNEANLAYRNRGGGEFESVGPAWGLDHVGVSFGAVTADFDRDGDLDLVVIDYDGGLRIHRNDTTDFHRVQVRLRGQSSNRFGVGAVVRITSPTLGQQSRTLTVSRGYASGSELVAHFGLGRDETIATLTVEWPSGITQTFTDLPADRAYLVTEAGQPTPAAPAADTLFADSTAARGLAFTDESALAIPDHEQVFLPFRTDRRGPGIATADVNGDGHVDLYLTATPGSPAHLLLWRDGNYVSAPATALNPDGAVEQGPALFFEADGNAGVDLLLTRASADASAWPAAFQPVLYTNDGRGTFRASTALPELNLNVGAACAADIDGDGDLDLFLGARSLPGRYPETPYSVLLRNDGGRFVAITDNSPALAAAGLVTSATFADLDHDGAPDLVLALEWDHVRVFGNDGHGRFSDRTSELGFDSGGRGWWNSVIAADFNRDGRLDIAAGNLGLNTTYAATPDSPATLLYGDFAQNGTPLLAEAELENGALYPVRGRADIGARLPIVLRKFRRNDDYARATLPEVLGEKAVAEATVLQADNFSSGVFLSQPDGRYAFTPLPRLAQLAPIQGMVAADLDGDGLIDLAVVQNSDAATPRFHGGFGLVLRGHGDGTFTALPPTESGLVATGHGRALVVIDPDGDARPDLFFTQHSGPTGFLAHQRSTDKAWLALRLRGPVDNPTAIGARIDVRRIDGSTTTHHLTAGSGWLSQGPTTLHLAAAGLDEVTVHWPDGQVTHHRDAPPAGAWTLSLAD